LRVWTPALTSGKRECRVASTIADGLFDLLTQQAELWFISRGVADKFLAVNNRPAIGGNSNAGHGDWSFRFNIRFRLTRA